MEPVNTPEENNAGQKTYDMYRATRRATSFFFFAMVSLLFRTMILPFIFAPLGIFFAYLAKGKREKNDVINNLVIFFCVVVLVINTAFCGYVFYSLNHDTPMHKQFDEVSERLYGVSFEEYWAQTTNALKAAGGTVE
jgi:fatty acid desaturase